MNKYRKKHLIAIQLCSIVSLILAVAASSKAQTPASAPASDGRSDMRSTLAFVPRFKLSFGPSGLNVIPANSTRTNIVRRSSISPESLTAFFEMTLGGPNSPEANLQPAVAAKAPLFTVAHDDSLQGDGTSQSPLGIKVPLNLNGSLSLSGLLTVDGLIRAHTTSGNAVEATGGSGEPGFGASGIKATGGDGQRLLGGAGVEAHGGTSQEGTGGAGVEAHGADGGIDRLGGDGVVGFGGQSDFIAATGVAGFGGASDIGFGGNGVLAIGGRSKNNRGGIGAEVVGGGSDNGDGGKGLVVAGGTASGNGHVAGAGIVARAGTAFNGAGKGLAGEFDGDLEVFDGNLLVFGDVRITGNLSKGSGSFKIDHPLDPENKYLSHSFVESPDMMNIYNGTVTTNAKGEAAVTLPDWFEALNQDFRYQLTVIGTFAQAIVSEEIKGNRFIVKTSSPNVKVSWQVTGIRHDAYANKHRIPVEEQKAEEERGMFLHPDAFNQPEEKGVQFVRSAPQIERMNAARERAKQHQGQP